MPIHSVAMRLKAFFKETLLKLVVVCHLLHAFKISKRYRVTGTKAVTVLDKDYTKF